MRRNDVYKRISEYGAIGNLRTVALVGLDGSVDWCCFPHMDDPGVFSAILDVRRGGRFQIRPVDVDRSEQEYVGDSNVLETRFWSGKGMLTIIDLMPLSGDIEGCGRSHASPEIHRILECRDEAVEVEVEWSPRFDYARAKTSIFQIDGGWLATGGKAQLVLSELENGHIEEEEFGPVLRARFGMKPGEKRVLVTRWGTDNTRCDPQEIENQTRQTIALWEQWAHKESAANKEEWAGKWTPQVVRSELVFKLLAHADTGAIAAAPTTSLPETIGGVRNWDYRYAWIRDASLTAQAMVSLGHKSEAVELLYWMERVSEARFAEDEWKLQIMYGLHGETDLKEQELSHLEGYRQSKPVRIGNEAATQLQLEVYAEVLNTGYELVRRGETLEKDVINFIQRVTNQIHELWEHPDQGIWEIRGEPRHFVYSKVMAWVALDRAIYLSEHYDFDSDVEKWKEDRDIIHAQVLEHGYNQKVGAFVQSFDSEYLDAANLRIPLLEFLPFDDYRVQGTIDRTLKDLTVNGLVYRYLNDDGLPGKEGAFGLCTFWLIDALALSNRVEEARQLFEQIASRANHVNLFAEQFDPHTGEFLGNFPQAFTHIGLINSALYLAYAEGRHIPEHAPMGTPTHRNSAGREHIRASQGRE